jgi:hypothetical protein
MACTGKNLFFQGKREKQAQEQISLKRLILLDFFHILLGGSDKEE